MNILIYGIGRVGNMYFQSVKYDHNVVGFLQTNKTQDNFCGKRVYGIDELSDTDFDEIHVANIYIDTLNNLLNLGLPKNKIVICHYIVYSQYLKQNQGVSDIRFSMDMVMTGRMQGDVLYSGKLLLGDTEVLLNRDYFRIGVLQRIVSQIKQDAVEGDMAELGVFRGEFSAAMNKLLPERKLLLFDTFEGFTDEDLEAQGKIDDDCFDVIGDSDFKNTSEDYVMDKMVNPDNCIICKGYFPKTIPSEEYRFALVSVDCDLYKPALEGLRYFYPRLSEGGYILLHDYNDIDFGNGIHKAVEDFEHEHGRVLKVPLSDASGTLVICK